MSNSLPRTMRRNAAISGSTSTNSNSKVLGFTVPSLSAWLLPWVRVTVFSLGRPWRGVTPVCSDISFCRARQDTLEVAVFRRPRDAAGSRSELSCVMSWIPGSPPSRGRQFEGAVNSTRSRCPRPRSARPSCQARRQVVLDHLRDRLEHLELVARRRVGPERHHGLERRAARQAAGDLAPPGSRRPPAARSARASSPAPVRARQCAWGPA